MDAYKTIFTASIVTVIILGIFLLLEDVLRPLPMTDPTIQGMLAKLFPLIAVGNVAMNTGMVCWALVGAQNPHHLATTIAGTSSLLVTIPIGVIMSVGLRIDLQGLGFAVVVGDAVMATLLSTCILMSNREELLIWIQAMVVAEEGSYSDSSSSSS